MFIDIELYIIYILLWERRFSGEFRHSETKLAFGCRFKGAWDKGAWPKGAWPKGHSQRGMAKGASDQRGMAKGASDQRGMAKGA